MTLKESQVLRQFKPGDTDGTPRFEYHREQHKFHINIEEIEDQCVFAAEYGQESIITESLDEAEQWLWAEI